MRVTEQEYEWRHNAIIGRYTDEICDHESAGCYGDAENARKWMFYELEALDREYKEQK